MEKKSQLQFKPGVKGVIVLGVTADWYKYSPPNLVMSRCCVSITEAVHSHRALDSSLNGTDRISPHHPQGPSLLLLYRCPTLPAADTCYINNELRGQTQLEKEQDGNPQFVFWKSKGRLEELMS